MDSSHAFVGDFGVNMNRGDNRFMNQFDVGGSTSAGVAGLDLSTGGLDFTNSTNNLLTETSSLMLGTGSSTAGLIDFPDELNSPTASTTTGSSNSGTLTIPDTSVSMMTTLSADAIPFPASLAIEPLSSSGVTPSSSAGLNVMNFMNTTNAGTAASNHGDGLGLDVNMGMNVSVNMGLGLGMDTMGMDMNANAFGMKDTNQMMFNNMQQQMNVMNPQMSYYMPQQQQMQQQQHYMQMMQQQRQLNLQRQQQQQKALRERQRQVQQQQMQKNNQQTHKQHAAQQNQQQMLAASHVPSQMVAQSQLSGGNKCLISGGDAPLSVNTARSSPHTPCPNAGSTTSATRQRWQTSADQALRKEMLNHIMRVLQNQRSNAPANWLQKLPEMAHRLEDECYRIAASREEYANTSTLQSRLRSIVRSAQTHQRNVGGNAMRQPGAPNQTSPANIVPASLASSGTPIPFPGQRAVAPMTNEASLDVKRLASQAIQMPPELQDLPSQVKTPVKVEACQVQTHMQVTPSGIGFMTDRLSMNSTGASPVTGQNDMQKTPCASVFNGNGNATSFGSKSATSPASTARNKSAQIIWQFKAKAQQVTSALDKNQTTEYHNKLRLMVREDVKTAGSKEVLQRQQQRLLLLRHAMWCKSPESTCATTPSCGEMKRLWAHMGACRQTNACSYSHCISSKYVLSHFQQCANAKCLVCQVVRYPVEVKEKNGTLMLDADRALQQIIAASQRRQRMLAMNKQEGLLQQQIAPQVQQPMPLTMPAHLQQPQSSNNFAAMSLQRQQQNSEHTGNSHTLVDANRSTLRTAVATAQSAGLSGMVGNVKASNTVTTTNSVQDDQRQFQLIKQKLNGRSLEQLTAHCVKLEKWVEEIRARMNAIMNECRQLLHLSNSTQDPMQKSQYEAQVQEKRVMLKQLDVKFKQCRNQRNIVKHVIDERNVATSMSTRNGAVASAQAVVNTSAAAMQPILMPAQIPQQNFLQQMQRPAVSTPVASMKPSPDDLLGEEDADVPLKVDDSLLVAGKPLEMPTELQDTTATPVSVAAPLNTLTAAQESTCNLSLTALNASRPVLSIDDAAPGQGQDSDEGQAKEVCKTDIAPSTSGSFGVTVKEVPEKTTGDTTTSPDQVSVKQEATVNPLTMNNSKLNAMMVEHRRMDASTTLQLPAGAVGTPKAIIATNRSEANISSAAPATPAPPASSEVPMSVLNELSNVDLASHISSLVTGYNATVSPAILKKKLEALLKGMMEHKFGWVFNTPVDPVALNIPNYFKIIRKPMDLGTVKKKLEVGVYKHTEEFAIDVRTTFLNAMQYNSEDQDVYSLAKDMLSDFNGEMRKLVAEFDADEKAARAKESSCRLCGIERMVFEPAVLYCNGECNSRIRRNCYYYMSADNKYHCCHQCFANLPDVIKHNEGRQYQKNALTRKKNDEVHEEPWVQCDKCERWVHQICALFNGKIDSEKKPQLIKSEGSQSTDSSETPPSPSPSATKSDAATTTTTVVKSSSSSGLKGTVHSITTSPGSEFLCPECLLEHRKSEPEKYKIGRHAFSAKDLPRTKLSDFLERRIIKSLQAEREDEAKWTQRDVNDVETAEGLTVRLVSNIEKQLVVRDKMFQRYKDSHKYTSEHRFKSKCICMFQELDGVSVLLFGMYVHEFDEQEADCNSRRVYISYLDSVNYFQPPHLRTKVYHELLIAYFDFVKQRGFHTAHLWACPPLKGDDYILYCHPEAQKTPKSDRLRAWYVDMLVKAEEEGVVWQITNMYDDYWCNDNTPCALPYFEGDYWVGLVEDLIEKLDAERPKKVVNKRGSKSQKRKTSDTKKAANKKSKSKKAKRRKTASGEEVLCDEDEDDDQTPSICNRMLTVKSLDTADRKLSDPLMHKLSEVIEPMKDDFLVVKLVPCCRVCNTSVVQGALWRDHSVKTEHGLNPKVVQMALCDGCYQKLKTVSTAGVSAAHHRLQVQLHTLTKEIVALPERCIDPDEINDSEFFDTRQAFLSLCQGNHYQFDELRRAKHSSMMALYHLGNPNPNAYVYECNACTRDIVAGNRWHCHTCPDFDVCDACYVKEKHEHPLEMVPTSGAGAGLALTGGTGGPGGAPDLTPEKRRLREQRAKNVRLHMQLLVHSSSCVDGNCGSSNCEKMKELMRHGAQCKQRAYGGCTICRRVWALLQLHARQCRQYKCKVPRCHDLREHVRKLQLQQQLMDDRRRAAVTQQYRQLQSERQQEQQGQAQGDSPMPQA